MKNHFFRFQEPAPSEITPQSIATARRQFLQQLAIGTMTASSLSHSAWAENTSNTKPLSARPNTIYTAKDKPTSFTDATTYNNFYEFGMDKDDPAQNAISLITRPWTISIEGLVQKPMTIDFDRHQPSVCQPFHSSLW